MLRCQVASRSGQEVDSDKPLGSLGVLRTHSVIVIVGESVCEIPGSETVGLGGYMKGVGNSILRSG